MIKCTYTKIIFIALAFLLSSGIPHKVNAQPEVEQPAPVTPTLTTCTPPEECPACAPCALSIPLDHINLQSTHSGIFADHRIWMIEVFFKEHIAFAMGLMTNQLTTIGMQYVRMIGSFFDAKHQLESQRLFQSLMAEAQKDYQPSEGVCDIGTNARGLIASERKTTLIHKTLANRVIARQLRNGENLAQADVLNSDLRSRVHVFKNTFCQKNNNANGLRNLCAGAVAPKETINKDVDYTRTVDSVLTIDLDFSVDSPIDTPVDPTPDEVSVFALMANLFAHDLMPAIASETLATQAGDPREAAYKYMNLRAVAAKRNVAQNSISAIIAEKATGDKKTEYAPFLKSAIVELGIEEIPASSPGGAGAVSVEEQVEFLVGKHPSYYAQMELLTKKLYQNPVFYTELYDKPANVLRKRTAIRAIGLMQDRDFYKSLLRNEVVLSVVLESMLSDEHDRVYANLNALELDGDEANE